MFLSMHSYKVTCFLFDWHICKLIIEISHFWDHIVKSFLVLELKVTFHLNLLLRALDIVLIEFFIHLLIFILNPLLLFLNHSVSDTAWIWIVLFLIKVHQVFFAMERWAIVELTYFWILICKFQGVTSLEASWQKGCLLGSQCRNFNLECFHFLEVNGFWIF